MEEIAIKTRLHLELAKKNITFCTFFTFFLSKVNFCEKLVIEDVNLNNDNKQVHSSQTEFKLSDICLKRLAVST